MNQKRYSIVYVDPPWNYYQNGRGSASNHYSTMRLENICNLPIKEISNKDCVLFLWATFPQLKEAFTVAESWGFIYKTAAFVWIKKNKIADTPFFGMGFWTRSNAEICILAIKGHPKRISKKIHQLIISPIEEHSKKPDIVRDKIVELVGELPRIELFARKKIEGWDTWGNEVENSIQM